MPRAKKKVSLQEKIDYVRRYEARQEASKLKYYGTQPVPGGYAVHISPSKPEDFLSEEERVKLLQISNRIEYLHSIRRDIDERLSKLYRRRQAFYDEIDRRIRRHDQYKLFEDRYPVLLVQSKAPSRDKKEKMLEAQLEQAKSLQRKLEAALLKLRQADQAQEA